MFSFYRQLIECKKMGQPRKGLQRNQVDKKMGKPMQKGKLCTKNQPADGFCEEQVDLQP